MFVHDGAELPAQAIANHCVATGASDRIRDLGVTSAVAVDPAHPYRSITSWPSPDECSKGRMAANSVNQAEIRARPRARRDRSTARPALFFIRRRNPCFFLRFRLFGWKVRFTHGLLKEGKCPGRSKREGLGHERTAKGEIIGSRPSCSQRERIRMQKSSRLSTERAKKGKPPPRSGVSSQTVGDNSLSLMNYMLEVPDRSLE